MSLIAMAVHDTLENNRSVLTKQTLQSLHDTVDFSKHRLFIIDNGSCEYTKALLLRFGKFATIITNPHNIGTAEAINLGWKHRKPNEHCIKIDNDVVINKKNWIEDMEEVINRQPLIGQAGLKRKDCWESPNRDDAFKSELIMLPHETGQTWLIVEKVNHVIGTCVMHSSALLDKIGYLYQPKLYGFDDSFASLRSQLAGFIDVFLPQIDVDHIDPGGSLYQKWKEDHAASCWDEYHQTVDAYNNGTKSIYYNPFI